MSNNNSDTAKPNTPRGRDRRQTNRFNASMAVAIRFLADGTPIPGVCSEIGANGIRVATHIPIQEEAYVHVHFEQASNNTHCEGRVVWTQRGTDSNHFESGIEIQRWGGGTPGDDPESDTRCLRPRKDRRSPKNP